MSSSSTAAEEVRGKSRALSLPTKLPYYSVRGEQRMATDAKQLYVDTISQLSSKERLQLAAMILEDLAAGSQFDDTWSEQDLRDLTAFSLSAAPIHEQDDEAS